MSEKVICCRAKICRKELDYQDCSHIIPHEIETWGNQDKNVCCTDVDDCDGHNVWCESVSSHIDFGIEELFEI